MLLILGAAFLSGCNAIIVRRMGHEKVLPLYPLYPFLFITLGSLPFVFTAPGWPATPLDLGLNMLIGAVSVAGIALYSTAFRIVPRAASIAPFHYIQMVWGVVFGYLLFGDLPGLTTYAGSALIISAGLYVLWHEKRSSRSDALI